MPALPLREEIRQALLGTWNPECIPLKWLESHEHGDWVTCDALAQGSGMVERELVERYAEAVEWAEAALKSVR